MTELFPWNRCHYHSHSPVTKLTFKKHKRFCGEAVLGRCHNMPGTHSVGTHAGFTGLGGLAGGSWSRDSLVLGISAVGLGGLRHDEGL